MCRDHIVWELWCRICIVHGFHGTGVGMCWSSSVCQLCCVEVAVCERCSVWELRCVRVVMSGNWGA